MISNWKRTSAMILCIALCLTQRTVSLQADVTIMVNGSFEAYPEWMNTGSSEWWAIYNTYEYDPIQFRWFDNDIFAVTSATWYAGIFEGAQSLADFISFFSTPNDALNVVAHSHGGNVAKIA